MFCIKNNTPLLGQASSSESVSGMGKKQLEERYEQCRNELESKKEQFRLMHKFLKSDSNGREAIALEAMALYNSSRDRLVALVKEAGEIRNKLEEA